MLVIKALNFAAEAHRDQIRKFSELPYIVHPMTVALWVTHFKPQSKNIVSLQCAAILHDTKEDTNVDYPDIYNEVGITADTALGVANSIISASSLWREYGRKIEKVRLQAKRGISNASSEEEIYSIFNNIEWQQ